MNKSMEFEVIAFADDNLEDRTWIKIEITPADQKRMLDSECKFSTMNDDPDLSDLTARVQDAAGIEHWVPFEGREDWDDINICDSSEYMVFYPREIGRTNRAKEYTLKGLRMGYDGGGMACGPCDGSKIIEAMVSCCDGQLLFVTLSRFMEYAKVTLSPAPLFDILMQGPDMDLNHERENKFIESLDTDSWEFENYDLPDDMVDSPLLGVYKLLLQAESNCPSDRPGEDFKGAQRLLTAYKEKNSNDLLSLSIDTSL